MNLKRNALDQMLRVVAGVGRSFGCGNGPRHIESTRAPQPLRRARAKASGKGGARSDGLRSSLSERRVDVPCESRADRFNPRRRGPGRSS